MPDGDYIVAVFLHQPGGHWHKVRRLADLATGILLDTGAIISAEPIRAAGYDDAPRGWRIGVATC